MRLLEREGNFLSSAEYRSYPSAKAHARPDVLRALLNKTRSDLEPIQQMLYSQNTWVMPYDIKRTNISKKLIGQSRLKSIQLECTEQVVLRSLRRSHSLSLYVGYDLKSDRCFIPWILPASQTSIVCYYDMIQFWLDYMGDIMDMGPFEHLTVVVRNSTKGDQLR